MMDDAAFQRKLSELIAEIATLGGAEDKDRLMKIAEQTKERHRQLKETVSQLQESIDFVRLSIKYLVFDLEATRRENAELKRQLGLGDSSKSTGGDCSPDCPPDCP